MSRDPTHAPGVADARRIVFLLSPAYLGGRRATVLLRPDAAFPLAQRVRETGAPLGEVFSFLSGLYFRGKLAYARAFGSSPAADGGVLVIVPGTGLVPPEHVVTREALADIASVGVALDVPRYRDTLERDAIALAATLAGDDITVLLGSIATGKYTEVLEQHLGERLHFPAEFVGRGDMSRGGLMLRHAASGQPLTYVRVTGATRRGARPPKLERLR